MDISGQKPILFQLSVSIEGPTLYLKTVLNEIWDDHPNMLEKDVRSLLGSFLFVGDDVKKVVHNLSGGEKARLTLTKLALQEDNFLFKIDFFYYIKYYRYR